MKNEIIKKNGRNHRRHQRRKEGNPSRSVNLRPPGRRRLREYEENGAEDICKATEKEIEEAYDDCVDYGCEEITPEELLRQIASHAECHDEHASIDRVNVWEV